MRVIYANVSLIYLIGAFTSADMQEIHQNQIRRRRGASSRVTGGSDVDFDKYKWFVQLGGNKCGGSLVSPEFILTAAHCYQQSIFETRARIGIVCQNKENCGHPMEKIAVKDYFKHPDFIREPSVYDFMLLRIKDESEMKPVEMDNGSLSPNYSPGRSDLWTIGLGVTDYQKDIKPFRLQHLELEYINNTECDELYAQDDWDVQDDMMCARNSDPAKQACFGDSGGPLYDNEEDKLVGVTSWGDTDCTSKSVVYSRVAHAIEWITSTICKKSRHSKPDFCRVQPSTSPSLSFSEGPSTSAKPSMSPSVSAKPSVSVAPSQTPLSQEIYFQMVSMSENSNKFCIQAGAQIKLKECDETNVKQLWRADASGQIRSKSGNESRCLTYVRREDGENLEMEDCEEEGKLLSYVFIFNGFQNTILFLKSEIDWKSYGLKAVSVKEISMNELVTMETHFYNDQESQFLQNWQIIYPDIALS